MSALTSNVLFVSRCLDRHELHPLGLAAFPGRQKLAAQPVLFCSIGIRDVPASHITKLDRIRWPVILEIGSSRCQQILHGWIDLCFLLRGLAACRWSAAASQDPDCRE